jgi:sec-independent protein translocase protein TatA
MGSIGPTELLVIALIALLLFGAGRIADIGKGLGQGIKNFKQGLKESDAVDTDDKVSIKKLADGAKSAKVDAEKHEAS